PKEAEKANIQGRVIIKFIIEADGSVTNPQIVKGVSPELDKEAIRLVRAMPKWTPAKNNGTNVASYFTIPISFKLKADTPKEEND
ncbi:MAG: energy transducer TonB, partial [Muribaculaceae bacterium]|nr:energy transducer TonB [Muribaculaceae bacterium]